MILLTVLVSVLYYFNLGYLKLHWCYVVVTMALYNHLVVRFIKTKQTFVSSGTDYV
mgnify:CR=1 FL=1